MSLEYYIIDTETTGTKTNHHEVFQLSILRHSTGDQFSKSIAVKYPDRASYQALNVTNTTHDDLRKGEPKENVIKEAHDFFVSDGLKDNARCIIAHNASFDRRFLHAEWESLKLKFPADLWLCTMAFTRKYAKNQGLEKIAEIQGVDKPKYKLDMCLKALGIEEVPGAHSAHVDVLNTNELFKGLMDSVVKAEHLELIKTIPHKVSFNNNFETLDFPDY